MDVKENEYIYKINLMKSLGFQINGFIFVMLKH